MEKVGLLNNIMKYIEVSPSVNIKKDEIISVERIDDMTCKVMTMVGPYESIYPAWRILMLLEQPNIEENVLPGSPESPSRTNLWGSQHFSG